ncbi:MAG: hypothetical protein Q8936_08490 [Bacillota bacterium]|nr:hypothetical protein [Bacillota bacterium]
MNVDVSSFDRKQLDEIEKAQKQAILDKNYKEIAKLEAKKLKIDAKINLNKG